MSYSELVELVNKDGFPETMTNIYVEYQKAKEAFEKAKQAYQHAESLKENLLYQAGSLVAFAAGQNITSQEEGYDVIRMVIGEEVVHFRSSGESYFIGYWPLTDFKNK